MHRFTCSCLALVSCPCFVYSSNDQVLLNVSANLLSFMVDNFKLRLAERDHFGGAGLGSLWPYYFPINLLRICLGWIGWAPETLLY